MTETMIWCDHVRRGPAFDRSKESRRDDKKQRIMRKKMFKLLCFDIIFNFQATQEKALKKQKTKNNQTFQTFKDRSIRSNYVFQIYFTYGKCIMKNKVTIFSLYIGTSIINL